MNKMIILGIVFSIFGLVATASAVGYSYNEKLFKSIPEMLTVVNINNNYQFEIHRFKDGETTCYLAASPIYPTDTPALDCVK